MSVYPLRPIGEIVENLDALRRPVKSSERRPGPYPYYGAQGIVDHVDGFLFDGEFVLVAEDGENLRSRNQPIALMARGRFWVNNHAHILRGTRSADTRFLFYALNKAHIAGYVTGSTIPKLSQGSLNRIQIPCPPIDEQRAIVAVLGALDDKIDLNRRMNETLEAMARAIFKDWFVDFGPTLTKIAGGQAYLSQEVWEHFPSSLNGDGNPSGWLMSTIGSETRVVGGTTPRTGQAAFWDGNIAWATPKDLSQLRSPILLDTERRITSAGLAQIGSGLLPAGTVLLSSRAPVGYLAISNIPVAVNQGFIAMVCDGRLSNAFCWLWSEANMDAIKQRANGSTFMEISKANFRPIPIVVPSERILTAFDEIAQPLIRRIVANSMETETLAVTRDLLLPKLMSGELLVRDAEKMVEAA